MNQKNDEKSCIDISVPKAARLYSTIREMKLDIDLPPIGVPPHITLQFPWKSSSDISKDDVLDLELIFKDFSPFPYSLKLGWFGNEVLILEPEEPHVFISMTEAIIQKWPEYPYYAGDYDKIEPHVILAYANYGNLKKVADRIVDDIPINDICAEINLSVGIPGNMILHSIIKLKDKD